MTNWGEMEESVNELCKQYPHIPKPVLQNAYIAWDNSRRMSAKERRKFDRMLDSLPNKALHTDFEDVQPVESNDNEKKGCARIE